MNQNQCNELRDLLFAARFASGSKEGVFRYLAVLPSRDAHTAAVIHYSYASPTWERAGENTEPEALIRSLVDGTRYADEKVAIQFHDYLRDGWHLPWDLTAKASHNDFPTLVLHQLPDGSVSGALMRDPKSGQTQQKVAGRYVEPNEVAGFILDLRLLARNERYGPWFKDRNIDSSDLEELAAAMPETDAGQKSVLIYRDAEWLSGLWNNPSRGGFSPGLHLSSVADFHGTRVSAAKRATRSGLDAVRRVQTVKGDCAALQEAVNELCLHDMQTYSEDYEMAPAVQSLCTWWNQNAPAEMRHAALFRTYIWDAENQIFSSGDPEEPALKPSVLEDEGAFALFEMAGRPSVAVQFIRGRAFNTDTNGGTQVYYANGKPGMDIGMDIKEVDEAWYALKGIIAVQRVWR